MEKHNLDSHFKKAIKESGDFYKAEAKHAQERVWNKVKTKKRATPLFYKLLAAASILLLIFLSSSVYFNLKYTSDIEQLVESNDQLKTENQKLINESEKNSELTNQIIDTVFVEKQKPQTQLAETTKTIRDTVYLKQIVYVEKETPSQETPASDIGSSEIASNINTDTNNKSNSISQTQDVAIITPPKIETSEVLVNEVNVSNIASEAPMNSDINEANNIVSNKDSDESGTNFQKNIIIKSDKTVKKKKSRGLKLKFGRRNSKIEKDALALSTTISK